MTCTGTLKFPTDKTDAATIASVACDFCIWHLLYLGRYFADRCVSKYLEAQQLIGEVLKKANEAQAEQQQQMMQIQRSMGG